VVRRKGHPDRVDQNWVRALSHPVRVAILDQLSRTESSPNRLKDVVGTTLSHASYHVKVLKECGCIEETRTAPRRGAVEHFFRAVPRTFLGNQKIQDLPPSLRSSVLGASYMDFSDKLIEFLHANDEGEFEGVTLEAMTVALDEMGLSEATKLIQGVLRQIRDLDSQSRKRSRPPQGDNLVSNMLGLSLFPISPPEAE